MAHGLIGISEGARVAVKSDGRVGVVSGLFPIKSGERGRPRMNVMVDLGGTIEEYGVKDLKLI